MATIDDLPIEILSLIFEYVGARARKSCSLVCRKWLDAKRCPAFYRAMQCSQQTMIGDGTREDFLESYHPYASLTFHGVENFTSFFPDDGDSVWTELDHVVGLNFVDCRGFFDKTLALILHHIPTVKKLTVIERNKFPWLVMQFPTITTLDLSKVAIALPKVLLHTLDCFPALDTLIIADLFLWQDLEVEISEICSLVPHVILSFENYFVPLDDAALRCFSEILNLEITSIRVDLSISLHALEGFLVKKGIYLNAVELQGTLDERYLQLINAFCTKLERITLNFLYEPKYNPFHLIKDLKVKEIKVSTGELLNLLNVDVNIKFRALKKLTLKGLVFFDEDLLHSFPNLSELNVLNVTGPITLIPSLHNVIIKGGNITDTHLETSGFFSLINMEAVTLEGPISDTSISKFSWLTLQRLTLIKANITVVGLKELCKKCPNLEYVSLKNCYGIEDSGAKVIAGLKNLKEVDLTGTSITEYGAKFFMEPALREQVLKTAKANNAIRRLSLIKELKSTLQDRKSNN